MFVCTYVCACVCVWVYGYAHESQKVSDSSEVEFQAVGSILMWVLKNELRFWAGAG